MFIADKKNASLWFPVMLLLVAMISLQGAASLAKHLFPMAGATGVAALRLGLSTLMLWCIFKPWRLTFTKEQRRPLIFYGLALGGMNMLFYLALRTIPLGIGVALEFLGPLTLALANSRRIPDFIWIIVTVTGLGLLMPLGDSLSDIDPLGAVLALCAGACWAIYIIFGRKAGAEHGPATVAVGSLIASVVYVPIGVTFADSGIWHWEIIPLALLVALLSNAIPYSLEMMALTRLPARLFGTLMSMEPVVAAISGMIFLSEMLTLPQWLGLTAIIVASAGSTLTMQPPKNKIRRIKVKSS
ncbi:MULTISPECIES: threonine/homoserine exporter RhtA [Tatumella]|uniref:Threonine/homoserine exporter RhtA n=1 Tax=Tatumella punctata TaxID=399969 RepID=A0ABW1VPV5_9GAMM|nr:MULTISPECIES: threonine/homoserine exporter RhtA [unclassified Tatumella]MBS0854675.1 threonine/homoserine exporter RhtA [Tatumella sp. JGM16]MBS0875946.1 threonine/homoserine exporter RhtA [Tatumella sp. JGM82]MBS0890351.1 threonine/homoserine exporter RhtA [Tatumella sp. JGM94]MBS0892543.1 threonine/homoserine exporter RhtA [Tatumella sp. JGM130]MBS0900477.1 threonine/homoserine exporter RhtA [Tatumella sp. JGM100]